MSIENHASPLLAPLNLVEKLPFRFHGLAGAAVFIALSAGMMAAFGTATRIDATEIVQRTFIESVISHPIPVANAAPLPPFVQEEAIRAGDSISSLLTRTGIDDPEALAILRKNASAQSIFRQLRPGKSITTHVSASGNLEQLVFFSNGPEGSAIVVERSQNGQIAARVGGLEIDTRVMVKSAEIRYSLFGATDAAEIPDGIALQLANTFGGEIDFHRDLRKGDRFAVVYEVFTHLGKEIGSGKLLAAEISNNGKSYRAAWFSAKEGTGGYYSAEGESLQKTFLRSPLEFSRITSGFTRARFHPLLKKWRAHKGIDYSALTGTRVRVTGDGVVVFSGTKGGYGKTVIVRHPGQYTTLYAHLSRFAPRLRAGSRVEQGEAIGFVGATGLASGPHLHYEFQVDGKHKNPLTLALPSSPALQPDQLSEFKRYSGQYFARIDGIKIDRNISIATID